MAKRIVSRRKSPRLPDPSPGETNPIDGHTLLTQVDQIAGVITLASNAVEKEADTNEALTAAWTALSLAETALRDLRYDLEGVPQALRWVDSVEDAQPLVEGEPS